MAFDKTPNIWMSGWNENGTAISVPIATFTELTAAEADSDSGDIRKIVWAFLKKWYDEYSTRSSTNQPSKWTCTRSISVNATTGEVANVFTNTLYTEIATQEVADES